jgi:hypothetical protein
MHVDFIRFKGRTLRYTKIPRGRQNDFNGIGMKYAACAKAIMSSKRKQAWDTVLWRRRI